MPHVGSAARAVVTNEQLLRPEQDVSRYDGTRCFRLQLYPGSAPPGAIVPFPSWIRQRGYYAQPIKEVQTRVQIGCTR